MKKISLEVGKTMKSKNLNEVKMKKELIVTSEDNNQEKLYAWIDENRDKLTFISKDSGCGCCVSIITVEGEEKIINTIPKEILL